MYKYLHVFFGIARGREADVAASVEQEGEATVQFAKVPIAAVSAVAVSAGALLVGFVVAVVVVDGAVAVGGDAVLDADVGRNAGVAVAVSGFAGLPKKTEKHRTVCQSLSDKHPVTFHSHIRGMSAQL